MEYSFEVPHGTVFGSCETDRAGFYGGATLHAEFSDAALPRFNLSADARDATVEKAVAGCLSKLADQFHQTGMPSHGLSIKKDSIITALRDKRREILRLSLSETVTMATAEKKEPKKRKPKQNALPGMEDKKIKELDQAVEEYKENRDERMAASEREVESKKKLMSLMKAHKLTSYKSADYELQAEIVVEEEGVKVKKWHPPKPNTEE